MTNPDHAALVERLENATGPDRELDRDIGFAVGSWSIRNIDPHGNLIYVPSDDTYYADHPGSMYPAFTESVDAALALAEKVLPSMRTISTCDDTLAVSAKIWVYPNGLSNGGEFMVEGMQQSLPLALCIAVLKAHGGADATDS